MKMEIAEAYAFLIFIRRACALKQMIRINVNSLFRDGPLYGGIE